MTSTARQIVYGFMAAVGLVATWTFNIQFMMGNGGFSLDRFVGAIYATSAGVSIGNDILIAAFTFLFWSYFETRRLGMRHWWLYAVLTLGVAMAFAFPLFMLMRERRLSDAGTSDARAASH